MKKAINNINRYQLDLFETDTNKDQRNPMSKLNKDVYSKSNSDDNNKDNRKKNLVEKSFNYSLGNKDNSFLLTYIDYECPQAFIADAIVTKAIENRLN